MGEHEQYVIEREKIDYFIDRGYKINGVLENLEGAFIEFKMNTDEKEEESIETLHIKTANGRKYFSALLLKQIQSVS
ncbi:hypothetical protein [Guptibacillus algicola]|uniref:hypothetical protein n=1 Tax=Guptibacillus algicola TaxID=225844 RepID=UPI001CD6E41B|nr:hypothetical protein [Alkalihalobacillus algicola]MCA0988306.1 hypothetical protein [Alkalihalobacillus algicola]